MGKQEAGTVVVVNFTHTQLKAVEVPKQPVRMCDTSEVVSVGN